MGSCMTVGDPEIMTWPELGYICMYVDSTIAPANQPLFRRHGGALDHEYMYVHKASPQLTPRRVYRTNASHPQPLNILEIQHRHDGMIDVDWTWQTPHPYNPSL